MTNSTITHAQEKVSHEVDGLADRATELIGSAAGAVADPKAGITKARKGLLTPKAIVLALVVAVIALVVLRARRNR